MIPVKLHVHNFLCYRKVPPLDFQDLHLACLAGDNGSGKSAFAAQLCRLSSSSPALPPELLHLQPGFLSA